VSDIETTPIETTEATEDGGKLPPSLDDTASTDAGDNPEVGTSPDTFPRAVVEDLRRENAKYRERANESDSLAKRLHTELVRATGRLADPTDLPFDISHLEDADSLSTAIDALLTSKPHLASRRPAGDVGQGQRGTSAEPFSLLGLLKSHT
jgi:hypothetical protein